LKALKSRRNNQQVATLLAELRNKAVSAENIMPAVLKAVEANCTLGEISDVLRTVYGEY
jgi:methylmalonyl-CoA mutase N-terminal domain/subunit